MFQTKNTVVKSICLLFVGLLISETSAATAIKDNGLYIKTFGDAKNQAIIFVHGGPGFHSYNFETTTAEPLVAEGFYVVIYDQRGQGRSDATVEKNFNYKTYADDLHGIIAKLGLKQPILLGHSHGGPIAIKFDFYYPQEAKKIILVSAPVNFWASMQSLFQNCATRYSNSGQTDLLDQLTYSYFKVIVDPTTTQKELIENVSVAFYHGLMGCKLYSPANPTSEALAIWKKYAESPIQGPIVGQQEALVGFIKNENYIHLNHMDQVWNNKGRYFAIYGDEDGLFTPLELSFIKGLVDEKNFKIIRGASHNIFVDQQTEFLRTIVEFAK